MKYCLYYWIFEPLRNGLFDSPQRVPSIEQILNFENKEYEFRLYCDNNIPEFVRVKFGGLTEETIPHNALEILQIIKEHLLSVLKISYREDIHLFPHAIWTFIDEGKEENVNVLTERVGESRFDRDLVKNLFISSLPMREELRLFVDGIDEKIPMQYRYLSLYKLLELKFTDNGKWRKEEFQNLLNIYQNDFDELKIKSRPITYLQLIRNKCAHIKSGKNKMELGVTHLNHREAARVREILPIIREVCRNIINNDAAGKFGLGKQKVTETIHPNKPLKIDAVNGAS